eukprot:gb/GFBE01052179.1/.p1 GENE.gb/GFBE01052179.1/~~gb/GFBE01052179.1/.p1  ORF type:complete len:235 (+),score=43.62 gb/GFBE01052179.1/:1-705(+)
MAYVPECKDTFFEGEPGLVGVFEYDYDEIITFRQKLGCAQLPLCPCSILWCHPCFLMQNIEWDTRARHLALTIDGIKFVHDKRKTMCGLSCTDAGKESKTVPYDKITDCDVEEPAGTAFCCCIQNVLHKVSIDTASSGGYSDHGTKHELEIEGLKHPHAFKQSVWAMKRGEMPENALCQHPAFTGVASSAAVPTLLAAAPKQVDMNTPLLTEIRDELKKLNKNLSSRYGSADKD